MSEKVEKKTKRVKRVKDEGEPSRPKTPYILFCIDERVNINTENASKDEADRLKNKEIIAELANRWKQLKETNPDKLEIYNKKADESRLTYTQEMSDWKKTREDEIKPEVVPETKKVGGTRKKKQQKPDEEQVIVVEEQPTQEVEVVIEEEDEKPKKKESVVKPKKGGANPYLNFLAQSREQYKKDHPDVPSKEVSSKLSEIWKGFTDEHKASYKN